MKRFIISLLLIKSFYLFSYSPSNNMIEHKIERKIVIVTASYNNKQWYKWNLDSVLAQEYDNYIVIYTDDCSTDGTLDLVEKHIEQSTKKDKFTLIKNNERKRQLANQYNAINSCKDTDIIIILDGDDRFAHNKVLSYINQVYADPNIWLTYGQFKFYPSGKKGFCREMSPETIDNNKIRNFGLFPSHLRTFYAGLFKQIKLDDLKYKGTFFHMCCDIATMYPMLEMARGHFKFIPDVLLEYNNANPLNIHKLNRHLQYAIYRDLCKRKPCDKIKSPFNFE